jgi:hypothetical protein
MTEVTLTLFTNRRGRNYSGLVFVLVCFISGGERRCLVSLLMAVM